MIIKARCGKCFFQGRHFHVDPSCKEHSKDDQVNLTVGEALEQAYPWGYRSPDEFDNPEKESDSESE